jgi:hypothetical protein
MPYQFVKLEVDGPKHVYLPLNRNYKPLGVGAPRETQPHVDYMDYVGQAVVFSKDPHGFTEVWHDPERLYLYSDNGSTQATYFRRLEKLMDRTVKLFGAPADD